MYNLYTLFIFFLSRLLLNPYYLSTGCRFFYQSDLFSTAEKRFWPRSWGLHSIDVHCTGIHCLLQAFQKKKKTEILKWEGITFPNMFFRKMTRLMLDFLNVFYVVKKICHTFGIKKKSYIFFFNFHFLLHKMINASAENIQWQLPRTFHKVKWWHSYFWSR